MLLRTFLRSTRRRRAPRTKPRGIALIAATFVLFFLLSLATAYVFSIRLEVNLARNYMDDLQAHYCAKAGVYRALGEIRYETRQGSYSYPRADIPDDLERIERYTEIYDNVEIGEGVYSVKFKDNFGQTGIGPFDESSLINISKLAQKGDRDTLLRLVEYATDDTEVADKVVDCLIDYCDADDNTQINGAERMDYEDLDPPALIANGPMKDPNEFLTILNVMMNKFPGQIDDTVWFGEDLNENGTLDPNEDDGEENPPYDDEDGFLDRGIRDFVTVDSGTVQVNPNTAAPEVLEIMMPENYQQVLEDRQFGPVQGGNTSAFRIRSYGTANGYTHVIEWVVRITGGGYPTVLRTRSL